MSIIHKHTTPDGQAIEHKHERGEEIHHHGWHKADPPVFWIAADAGYYFDDLADEFGEKRKHTPQEEEGERCYEIPLVLVLTGFNNEFDAAEQAAEYISLLPHGSTPLDAVTMPANLDVSGADDRSGTIVYGSDNRLIVKTLEHTLRTQPGALTEDERARAQELIGYLSKYFFNGA